jgi:hypothetical protein
MNAVLFFSFSKDGKRKSLKHKVGARRHVPIARDVSSYAQRSGNGPPTCFPYSANWYAFLTLVRNDIENVSIFHLLATKVSIDDRSQIICQICQMKWSAQCCRPNTLKGVLKKKMTGIPPIRGAARSAQ